MSKWKMSMFEMRNWERDQFKNNKIIIIIKKIICLR